VGIFGVDHRGGRDARAVTELAGSDGAPGGVTGVFERLMDVGIDGKGRFDSAQKIADVARVAHPDAERAIDAIVRSHLRLAAAGGFVTSLGGFVTMPVALPANVLEFYLVATRMVAGIASTRGYDIFQPEAGYASTGRLAGLAVERLPGPVLLAVNKGVAFRLLNQVGKKSLTRFGKAVPLAGGVIGAGVDTYLLNRIADHARLEFPPVGRPVL
jgi:hypothetical protein